MYGSVSRSLEQEESPTTISTRPLLSKKKKKKPSSRSRQKFIGVAHAVRSVDRFQKSKRLQQQSHVFGNLFETEQERKQQRRRSSVTRASAVVAPPSKAPPQQQQHSFLYSLLNSRSHSRQAVIFKRFLSIIIVTDLLFFILSTEPRFQQENYHRLFYIAEGAASTVFFVEYAARLVVVMESKRYKNKGPIQGRLLYMMSWSAVIDALATFPFFLELVFGVEFPRLTYLRFLRLLRIMRTESFSKAADCVVRVIYYNREILQVALIMCVYLVLFTAILLYYCRPRTGGEEAEGFKSIGATMYMSTLMLTGQGGPEGDLPWYTKAIVLLTGVFSIGMFAIPASMLTWGFEAEAQRVAARARRRFKQSATSSTSSFSSNDTSSDDDGSVSTSDEEYLKIIAGEDDDEDDELLQGRSREEQAAMQELLDRFRKFDTDQSGSLTKKEFLELVETIKTNVAEQPQQDILLQPSPIVASLDDAQQLTLRVERLERKVDETHDRLDKLLLLLQKRSE